MCNPLNVDRQRDRQMNQRMKTSSNLSYKTTAMLSLDNPIIFEWWQKAGQQVPKRVVLTSGVQPPNVSIFMVNVAFNFDFSIYDVNVPKKFQII